MIRALLILLLVPVQLSAGEVRLAVASNAYPAVQAMADIFTRQTGHDVSIAHGATGRLYTQITQGAPFDIFLSADTERPERLEREGRAIARRTFAVGRLVLIGEPDLARADRIAIADPALAPYGIAAIEALRYLGIETGQKTLLLAENIAQVAVWVDTGNADAGLLAASLVRNLRDGVAVVAIPPQAHVPIRQDAALLTDTPAARAFWDWLFTDAAGAVLRDHGYDLP